MNKLQVMKSSVLIGKCCKEPIINTEDVER